MAGHLSDLFASFLEKTGEADIDQGSFIKEANDFNEYLWARFARGTDATVKRISGGSSMRWDIQFEDNGSYGPYNPGEPGDWKNHQPKGKAAAYFTHNRAHWGYVRDEIDLNEKVMAAAAKGRSALWQQFESVRDLKEYACMASIWNGIEDQFWAVPDFATMEGEDPEVPTSIMSLITEETDGLPTASHTAIHGLDPGSAAVNGRWTNQRESYTTDVVNADDNVISAFSRMWRKIKFSRPDNAAKYFESPLLNKQVIVTSTRGLDMYEQLLRAGQDRFVTGKEDPSYNDPTFRGIPLIFSDAFQAGTYYDDGTQDEFGGTDKGPRFVWINGNYLVPALHPTRFIDTDGPMRDAKTPDTYVIVKTVIWNLIALSRRRQGIVSPSGSVWIS